MEFVIPRHVTDEDGIVAELASSVGFYVGDSWYVLGGHDYDYWGKCGYGSGVFKSPGREVSFVVGNVSHGDGYYIDDAEKYCFYVETGCICVIPMEMIPTDVWEPAGGNGFGQFFPGATKAHFEWEDGKFWVRIDDDKEIIINTNRRDGEEE